jgi:DNA processing protein
MPSDFVSPGRADECAAEVMRILKSEGVHRFGVRVNHAGDYPTHIRVARHPIELLYYQGAWELTETPCVAVVGSREATDEGIRRARPVPLDRHHRPDAAARFPHRPLVGLQ